MHSPFNFWDTLRHEILSGPMQHLRRCIMHACLKLHQSSPTSPSMGNRPSEQKPFTALQVHAAPLTFAGPYSGCSPPSIQHTIDSVGRASDLFGCKTIRRSPQSIANLHHPVLLTMRPLAAFLSEVCSSSRIEDCKLSRGWGCRPPTVSEMEDLAA